MARPERSPRPDLRHERSLARRGLAPIAGLDEAGRGALAGPLYAAAVILPVGQGDLAAALRDVRDSKMMTPRQRRSCADRIQSLALAWTVASATSGEVDDLGPLQATYVAMRRALTGLSLTPRHLLIDHVRLPDIQPDQTPVTHGDARVLSIAAASVLAKVARDQAMDDFAHVFPTYGFSHHKGYGTAAHLRALRRWGPCPIHRRSYQPVAILLRTAAS